MTPLFSCHAARLLCGACGTYSEVWASTPVEQEKMADHCPRCGKAEPVLIARWKGLTTQTLPRVEYPYLEGENLLGRPKRRPNRMDRIMLDDGPKKRTHARRGRRPKWETEIPQMEEE